MTTRSASTAQAKIGVVPALGAGLLIASVGALAEGPLWSANTELAAGNVLLTLSLVTGATMLGREPGQRATAVIIAISGLLWCLAWANYWQAGPWPLLASWVGPMPEVLLLLGLLRYPRPSRRRSHTVAIVVVAILLEGGAVAATLVSRPAWNGSPTTVLWPALAPDRGLFAALSNALGIAGALATAGFVIAFALRSARMSGHDRTLALPIAFAVCLAALGTVSSNIVDALGIRGLWLDVVYSAEDILLLTIPVAFVGSVILRRSSVEAIGQLAPHLRAGASPAEVQDELRHRLSDPTLEIQWVGVGVPMTPTPGTSGSDRRMITDAEGHALASVSMRRTSVLHEDLVRASLDALRMFAENRRLLQRIEADIVATSESERRLARLASTERSRVRSLAEDGPSRLLADAARSSTAALLIGDPEVTSILRRAIDRVQRAAASLNELSDGRDPAVLERDGLVSALEAEYKDRPDVRLTMVVGRIPQDLERAIYYFTTEAVTNATKHASASHIDVRVQNEGGSIDVMVVDDGLGLASIDPRRRPFGGAQRHGAAIDVADAQGGGTVVHARFAVPGPAAADPARAAVASR